MHIYIFFFQSKEAIILEHTPQLSHQGLETPGLEGPETEVKLRTFVRRDGECLKLDQKFGLFSEICH